MPDGLQNVQFPDTVKAVDAFCSGIQDLAAFSLCFLEVLFRQLTLGDNIENCHKVFPSSGYTLISKTTVLKKLHTSQSARYPG